MYDISAPARKWFKQKYAGPEDPQDLIFKLINNWPRLENPEDVNADVRKPLDTPHLLAYT